MGRSTQVKSDVAANDSDKSFTIPTDQTWQVSGIYAKLVTTATAGNRTLKVLLTDSADTTIWTTEAAANQAASVTRHYLAIPGGALKDNSTQLQLELPLPNPCIMSENYKIRVFDSSAVDAAADDLDVFINYMLV